MKTNSSLGKRYLIVSDFDDTLFRTSEPSPTGMTVQKAYIQSFDDIFGKGTGELFFSINGFHGEGPSQIIKTLLNTRGQSLIDNASQVHREQNGNFPRIIPESQDGKIKWHNERPEMTLTPMLIIQKLSYLLREIGTLNKNGKPWPLPCEGVLDFFQSLDSLKKEGVPIDFAIVSSGHESFIKRVLDAWNLPQPDILVTEDDLRLREFPKEAEIKFKPGVFPVALAHFAWLRNQGLTFSKEIGLNTRTRIMHIGDTPTKDLVMADRAGIASNFLYPSTSWEAIIEALITNKDLLDSRPFSEIFATNRDGKENNIPLSNDYTEMSHQHAGPERR